MPVLKRRNRIVVFRLTQQEYEDLKQVSSVRGARTLSDYARSELLTSIQRQQQSGVLDDLNARLRDLQAMLERLLERQQERS